ncbi:MAG: hypothetical protein L0387_45405 [Acidobacteria bacterium]|nr:hypothetical protein [Acidobacteriota bacterium]MCI0724491.1 hypothetical protein [Acidobacteriota bacterium]
MNWDHTFSANLLNHFGLGYSTIDYFGGSVAAPFANELPKIPGAASFSYPPTVQFTGGFTGFGNPNGSAEDNAWPAPSYIASDLVTWVKGEHVFKFGAEYRYLRNTRHISAGEAGVFNFSNLQTGLLGINSGNPVASFLLEQVNSASVSFLPFGVSRARADGLITHFADTWKVRPRLTFNYGLRWEMHRPYVEKDDVFSFFDPVGPNPGAGGRRGRLVFAGDEWGAASFGKRHPEETFLEAFGPRIGIAYAPNGNTVIRAGYGIFYDMGNMPGFAGGIGQDGFSLTQTFSSTQGGLVAPFTLRDGFPQDFRKPPFLDPSFLNGQAGPLYRPVDSNRLPYAQHWNLTLERQFGQNLHLSAAYVANKSTRLLSAVAPLNALDPRLLSLGSKLNDQFGPGQVELHGVSLPYPGWREQMKACAPSLAQALLPFPQYCGPLRAINENQGSSSYHSFQFKAEKRHSSGLWVLGSYTVSKLLTNTDFHQPAGGGLSTQVGVISPFQRYRTKGLALMDVPQILSIAFTYELPLGKGKRWLVSQSALEKLVGGWTFGSTYLAQSGSPFFLRSGRCNLPSQFRMGCIPAILPGAEPWAQDKNDFEPTKPLFALGAFEPVNAFDFYGGQGPRVSNLRNFGYHNHDLILMKNTRISERILFQLRFEFFNLWNWHTFTGFSTNVSAPDFGRWTGAVTKPRQIQVGASVAF